MATNDLPTPDLLRKVLRYEPDTGKLFWLPRTPSLFRSPAYANRWNARYAHQEAFTAIDAHGYRIGRLFGRGYKAHRVIMAMTNGAWPEADVDHINRVRSDNRIVNLRLATRSQNLSNSGTGFGGTSKFRGVKKVKTRWIAVISHDNKGLHLGCFGDEVEAARAFDAAAKRLRGEGAYLNFPDPPKTTQSSAQSVHRADGG